MRNYGVINGMIRVNKSRARAMYNNGYEIRLEMGSEKKYLYMTRTWSFISNNIYDGEFDHIVLDFYINNKGNDVGYTVEYWVAEIDNKEYLREYNKEWWRKHKAKMNR